MINLETAADHFKDHVATFTDLGNIKILDFKNPDSNEYRIRFLFEEDYYRLHISGDLGELIACNYKNMRYEEFFDFVNSTGYFEEKVRTHSRPFYVYDYERAKEELRDYLDLEDFSATFDFETPEKLRNEKIEEILEDFDDERGIGSRGYDILSEIKSDCYEFISDIGKERTGIIELYMMAFELAYDQIEEAK